MSDFLASLEPLLRRRCEAVLQIDTALAHLPRHQLIAVLTSYIDLDQLEEALPTICGSDNAKSPAPEH